MRAIKRWASVTAIGGAVVLLAGSTWVGGAAAAPADTTAVGCGSVVTTSITLTHDLHCSGNGLLVQPQVNSGAIVINLGGHRITGAPGNPVSVGISIPPGNVAVENGAISGFNYCISANSDQSPFSGLRFADCEVFGVAHGPDITYSTFDHAWADTNQSVATYDHDAFVNGAGLTAIEGFETYTTVTDSVIYGYDTGIWVYDLAASANIQRTAVIGGGVGIRLGQGTPPDQVPGIVSSDVITGNRSDGINIDTTSVGGYGVPPNQLTVTSNRITGNGGDGIRAAAPPGNSPTLNLTIGGNRVIGNGGNGIAVTLSPSLALTDAGGDQAIGNASPQCINVACTPRGGRT